MSRDSLIFTGRERLCPRCSAAREAAEQRVQRLSGWILAGCSAVGGLAGYLIGAIVGIFVGLTVGLTLAGFIEKYIRRY